MENSLMFALQFQQIRMFALQFQPIRGAPFFKNVSCLWRIVTYCWRTTLDCAS